MIITTIIILHRQYVMMAYKNCYILYCVLCTRCINNILITVISVHGSWYRLVTRFFMPIIINYSTTLDRNNYEITWVLYIQAESAEFYYTFFRNYYSYRKYLSRINKYLIFQQCPPT